MNGSFSRRRFIKTTAAGGMGWLGSVYGLSPLLLTDTASELHTLSRGLVNTWGKALLALQITDTSRTEAYGGIWCPARKIVHGRVGDTIYPFLHLARHTKDSRYLDGARLLYRWMERRVSQEDGSWLNEPVKGAWKGTTVFSIIALCEALHYHGDLLDNHFKQEVQTRLKKAGDFVYNNFTINYGNINYPITAAYGLTLLGELLDIQAYKTKGRELAHQALGFFTRKDGLLFGEGDPYYQPSPKGCYPVDLGYNVEESLPSLVQYGLLTRDEAVLEEVTRSLQAHMQFMLPDGGWDNSWGTRNYKWTYWGSRTSDGCQPAYALLANRDARFYQVALKNTLLMKQCTQEGLLYGGPHCAAHKVPPSVHHTFCHIKALTTILDHDPVQPVAASNKIVLPRETTYGVRFFEDIQTWLISLGGYRATVTGYDREYKRTRNGHASGGAMTMLWHEATGPLITASMNEYQMWEAMNMQEDTDPLSICLTPRMEWTKEGAWYTNISDLQAEIKVQTRKGAAIVSVQAKLVDKDQQSPVTGSITCNIQYIITEKKVRCRFACEDKVPEGSINVVFPVISSVKEQVKPVNDRTLTIEKEKALVKLTANTSILLSTTTNGRVFNFVPGLEAVPLALEGRDVRVELEIINK